MLNYPTYGLTPAKGSLDTSFDQGSGFNKQVLGVAEYGDEYVFWGDNGSNYYSAYNSFSSLNSNKIVPFFRVKKTNKLPDTNSILGGNFNFGNLLVQNQFVIAGGYIYFVGGFSSFNNIASKHILKINESDLTVDTVNTGVGFSSTTSIQIWYANSKIFVGGSSVSTYNGGTSTRLQVFNTDLTVDSTLTSFFLPNNTVTCVFEQADGKTVIAGTFTSIGGTTQNRLVRYNTDWTVDTTFTNNVGTGPSAETRSIKQLSNGKLVLGGTFTTFNSTASQRVIILNTDGTISTSVASGQANGEINAVAVDGSDNIFCGGFFQTYGGTSRLGLCKLSNILALDVTYAPVFDTNATIYTLNIEGSELIVGTSNLEATINGDTIGGIFSTDLVNGTLVDDFNGGAGTIGEIRKTIVSGDYIYIYGGLNFTQYGGNRSFDGELVSFISFVDKNGTLTQNLDKFYDTSGNSYNITNCLKVGDDLYITTTLNEGYGLSTSKGIVKFTNKVLDTTFTASITSGGGNSLIYDNGVIVVGNFTSPKNRIVKLNSTGGVDTAFDVGTGFNATFGVRCITKLSNGNYLVTGQFTTYKGVTTNRICVLNTSGTKVGTFVEGTGLSSGTLTKSIQLSNGNYLIYGNFTTYKSVSCNRAIILDATGTQIARLSSNFNATINKAVEYNGKIYFTGSFVTFGATTVNRIACIDLATGTLENIFGTGLDGTGNDLIIDNGGKLVVVGNFTTYNDNPVGYVARIFI